MPSRLDRACPGRRQFLFGTAAMVGAFTIPSIPALASTVPDKPFLTASRLLVNHELNPVIGARMATFAAENFSNLDAMLEEIIQVAKARNATLVEEFFDDLPQGEVRDFAYWMIETWYTGSSSNARDARLFTYEEALLYRPTLDMVPIPTFGLSAPNAWGRDLYPLAALPQF